MFDDPTDCLPKPPILAQQPNINVFTSSLVPPIKQTHKILWHNLLSSDNNHFIPYKTSSPFLEHNVQTVNYRHIPQSWTPFFDSKHNYPKNSFLLRNTYVYFSINQFLNDAHHPIKFRVIKPPLSENKA